MFFYFFIFFKRERMDNRLSNAMQAVDAYIADKEHKSRRPATIRTYRTILRNTLEWLSRHGYECEPERIGEQDIRALIRDYGASEATIKYYVSTLGSFLREAGNDTVHDMSLLWNETPHPNVRWIGPGDFERILRHATDPTDRVAIRLMSYAGLRRGEVAALEVADILSDCIIATGKGHGSGKKRIVPLHPKLAEEINKYMTTRQEILGAHRCSRLIVAKNPNGAPPGAMSPSTISDRIRRLCRAAGVDATPHSFRRYFATQIWQTMPDKDMCVLQKLLGHTSPIMTMRYIETNRDALCQAVNRL